MTLRSALACRLVVPRTHVNVFEANAFQLNGQGEIRQKFRVVCSPHLLELQPGVFQA